MKPKAREKPITTILDPEFDRYQVGLLTYYCLNPCCPVGRFPDRSKCFVTEEHFTIFGRCRRRHRDQS